MRVNVSEIFSAKIAIYAVLPLQSYSREISLYCRTDLNLSNFPKEMAFSILPDFCFTLGVVTKFIFAMDKFSTINLRNFRNTTCPTSACVAILRNSSN